MKDALGNMAHDLERVAEAVCHAFDLRRAVLFSQIDDEVDENGIQARAAFVLIAFGYGATKGEIRQYAKLKSDLVVMRWYTLAMRRWRIASFRLLVFGLTRQLGIAREEVCDAV